MFIGENWDWNTGTDGPYPNGDMSHLNFSA
jgi:hypothetical protein